MPDNHWLDELEELERKATTGPWTVEKGPASGKNWLVGHGQDFNGENWWITTDEVRASEMNGSQPQDDCAFVAAMRSAAPRLIAIARAAREYRDSIRRGDYLHSDDRGLDHGDIERKLDALLTPKEPPDA